MKAAVVRSFDRPLEIEDLPIPEPGAGQVLVRIETCGLCHTDIHAARGEWPVKPSPPFIPGHEGVGIIERLGAGEMYGLEPGMRVALPWLGYACGVCRYCNTGRETLCPHQLNMGYAHQRRLRRVRARLRPPCRARPGRRSRSADASPLTCAGVTTYKAVKVSGATLVEPRRRLRRRRARPPGDPVRAHHRRVGRRRRRQPGAAGDGARAVGAEHVDQPARGGSGRRDPAPRRRRRRDLHRGVPEARSSRPSARSRAAASSSASACRPTTT